jgi:hypothetical protein
MSYIQIPPDSTGKRIFAHNFTVSGVPTYVQGVNLVSHSNPEHGQNVDTKGAAYVRFAEGEPILDAYSNLKFARSVPLGVYDHANDSQDDLYTIVEESGGLSSYSAPGARVTLSCNTSANAYVSRTINRYHFYNTGTGTTALLTVQCGDLGKENNIRRWGYYDDENGYFIQVSGSEVSFVARSSVGGSVTDTVYPQSTWSHDILDGSGLSQYNLEIDEAENYWINIQWPGVARFGVYSDDGERILAHTTSHSTALSTKSTSLPLRLENFNIAGTISTTELSEYAMSVYNDNPVDYTFWRFSDMETSVSKVVTTQTPVLSVRSNLLVNGEVNRISTYPQTLSVNVSGGAVKMEILFDVNLSGATWALSGESTIEGDVAASSLSIGDGYKFVSEFCGTGITNIDLTKYYELNDEGIMVNADGSVQPITTFAFTALTGTSTAVDATLTYRELR